MPCGSFLPGKTERKSLCRKAEKLGSMETANASGFSMTLSINWIDKRDGEDDCKKGPKIKNYTEVQQSRIILNKHI